MAALKNRFIYFLLSFLLLALFTACPVICLTIPAFAQNIITSPSPEAGVSLPSSEPSPDRGKTDPEKTKTVPFVVPFLETSPLPVPTESTVPGNIPPSSLPSPSPSPKASPSSDKAGVPVIFEGKALFSLYATTGPYSADVRAKFVSERIYRFARSEGGLSTVTVENQDSLSTVSANRELIISIADDDVVEAGEDRKETAAEYARIIRLAVEDARNRWAAEKEEQQKIKEQNELKELNARKAGERTRRIVILIFSTIILFFWFPLLNFLFPRIRLKIENLAESRIKPLRIQKLELISSGHIHGLMLFSLEVFRLILILISIYIYINLALGQFEETRVTAELSYNYSSGIIRKIGAGILSYIPNLISIIITCIGAYYSHRLSDFIFSEIANGDIVIPGFHLDWVESTNKILKFLIIIIAVIIVFPFLPGYESPAFKGISVFLGLLISLGSSSAVSNIMAGVILTYTLAFKVGDRVKIGDSKGDIIEKSLLVTRLRTIKNEIVSIPNGLVMSSQIINYSLSAGLDDSPESSLILHTTVTIGYDAPWRQVHQLLIDSALLTENILAEPLPFVLQTSLDDNYVSYQLNAYTSKPSGMAQTYSRLHQNIQDSFNKAGVEIMSPHYRAVRDGNEITIPQAQRPEGYEIQSFRISQDKK